MSIFKNKKRQPNKDLINPEDSDDLLKYTDVSFIYSPKTFFETIGVQNINCKLKKNRIISIIGASGSGKSTFVHLMNGIFKPSKGEIVVYNITKFNHKTRKIPNVKLLRQNVGSVFQFPETQLFQDNVLKDIIFGPLNFGYNRQEAETLASNVIDKVGLNKSFFAKNPFSLSGGEKRRVALAGILITKPKVLLLDEPTAGLDPEGEENFKEIFKNLKVHEDVTILIITHNMDHVLELSDEVIVFKNGQILKHATPFEIFSDKKLISENNLNLPFVYEIVHKIRKKNPDFLPKDKDLKVRTIDDLVQIIKKDQQNVE
ncbi:ATP-binding cassette domain-containing protein [Mycoplasma sp. SG1]|uniref:ATP-binding cassette domain-containing protein n=1 Tax=Mycoplasma sp. SG1 TaxID=2810348 RepID=UPI002023D2DF|nr:ATP-binding cassette domain-containing protein [Mycoplasma sp. SG1]URM52919.1 ATP-binding cassette domain-containing protein [Mycoplasma sp. SG1]